MRTFLLICFAHLFLFTSNAQNQEQDLMVNERCSTMEHLAEMQLKNPELVNQLPELNNRIKEYLKNLDKEVNGTVLTIPTVIHVVHDNKGLGIRENLSDTYLYAQINQINDDFRRTNSDASGYWSQAADTEIEFCLASVDPNGNPTNGIVRHNINGIHYTKPDFDANIKPVTIWDRDLYLNIWICDLTPGLLGYAQFPGGPSSTDGIVVDFITAGSLSPVGPFGTEFKYGRTASHEIGHWLGLFHIWGDDTDCSGSDLCADTPNQEVAVTSCLQGAQFDVCTPSHPGIMYQNYMDYTDDLCMNLFTVDQKDRMWAAVNTDRPSLLTAACGVTVPIPYFLPSQDTIYRCSGARLIFEDKSSGQPDSWSWTFAGAGATPTSSSAQNPTIEVYNSGTMTVTLTAGNSLGSATFTKDIEVVIYPLTHSLCNYTPCLELHQWPTSLVPYGDRCIQQDCTPQVMGSVVFNLHGARTNKGYILPNLRSGTSYTFDFCDGYNPGVFEAVITIGEWGGVSPTIIPNSQIAAANGCSITFTPSKTTDYVAVVSELGNCGGYLGDVNNGIPFFQCNTPCATQCGEKWTDAGGFYHNYPNNEDEPYLICPDDPSCEVAQVVFNYFDMNTAASFTAYDGITSSDPMIGSWTGTNNPGVVTSTHSSGCLFFHFVAGGAYGRGWRADVNCVYTCGNNCPPDYAGANALTGSESGMGGMNSDGDYETNGDIQSTQIITGGTIDYDSGTLICMDPGFEVVQGAIFDAFIDGCNNGGGGNTFGQDSIEMKK